MLNKRCLEILELFIKQDSIQFVDNLSSKFNVSKRMIRYDIDSINCFLKTNNITQIEKKPNSPLKLKINIDEKNALLKIINNLNIQTYILSTDERVGIIIYELLSSANGCVYKNLQEKLLVSKTTIVTDLKKVKKWLYNYNLQLIKYSNKGIKINGEEKNIRKAMTDLLVEDNSYNIITSVERLYSNQNNYLLKNLDKIELNTENLNYIKDLVSELEEYFGIFSDYDFMNLVVSIYIIINRCYNKNILNNISHKLIESNYKKEYIKAEDIAKKINMKFNINIDKEEISYLASKILSSSKNDCNIFDSGDYFEACNIADTLIFEINKNYIKNFKMDKQLLESFINHLKSLIFRLKFDVITKNPILDTIKNNYETEFNMIKNLSFIFKNKLNCNINDDEIGYITIYICAAIEKTSILTKNSTKNILIVCSSGFATGRLLEHNIKNNFDVNIIGVTSVHNINKYIEKNNIDYIISTLNINKKYNVPIIMIPAIFKNDDIYNLSKYLLYKPKIKNNIIIDDLLKIIEKNCDIYDKNNLINNLNKYLKIDNNDLKNIKDYINTSNIQLNIDAKDWIEGIKISALPLLKNGSIEEEYIQAIIDNVNKFGSYIVVDDNIAIPHAKPDKYVHDFGISINTFKNPLKIGEHENINIFITIASTNNEKHINLIIEIMKLIENKKFIDAIINAKNPNDIIKLL